MEVLVEREGRGSHISKGLGVKVNCRLNWYGWVLNGSFGREGGRGQEAVYERGWDAE